MMKRRLVHGLYLIFEKILRWCINPYLRAFLLRLLGATIGKNVRVYEVRFFNLMRGFKNLIVADDAHIGPDVLIDLSEEVIIEKGAVISPRVSIFTHSDPGSYHNSPICKIYPPANMPVKIGQYAWIGTGVVVLGANIGEKAVVGACSFVNSDIPPGALAYGLPAKVVKQNLGAP